MAKSVKTEGAREPFVRVAKKGMTTKREAIRIRIFSLLFALVLCLVFILIVGKGEITIGRAISSMWKGTFGIMGNSRSMQISIWDTAIFTAKLINKR